MKYGGLQANMFNDPKIIKLENKYGSVGVHCWLRTLTSVYDKITPRNLTCRVELDAEILAAYVRCEESLASLILNYMATIGLTMAWQNSYYCPNALLYADKTTRNQVANIEEIVELAKANLSDPKKTSFYIDIKPNTQWPRDVLTRVVYGLHLPSQSLSRSKLSRVNLSKRKVKEVESSEVDLATGQPTKNLSDKERQSKISFLSKKLSTAQTFEEQKLLQDEIRLLRQA